MNRSLSFWIVIYVSIPVFIFWAGWFNGFVAFAAITAWFFWFWSLFLDKWPYAKKPKLHSATSMLKNILICTLLAVFWAYLAGVGNFRPQHFDYYKHNLIFNNLTWLQWPVRYADQQYLCYYLAYYLPAATLAKLYGGLDMVHWYSFIWTSAGLTLLFVQLHRLGGWWFIIWFVLFNSVEGILIVYEAIKSPHTLAYTLRDLWTNDHTIELIFTPGGLVFPSHAESITAVPQHSVAAWLVLALYVEKYRTISLSLFVGLCALLLYWSPLVVIGILPFVIYRGINVSVFSGILSSWSFISHHFSLIAFHSLLIIIISFPVVVYYAGHVPMVDANGWWWVFLDKPHQFVLLLLFVCIEVGVWAVLVFLLEQKYKIFKNHKILIYSSLASLFILTFYRYGHFNDLARRASLPVTFVLCWGLWQYIYQWKKYKTYHQLLLAIVLIFAVALPIKHHLKWLSPHPYMAQVNTSIKSLGNRTIYDLERQHRGEFDVVAQYLGQQKSWYSQYFAAK
jgi:hypothetical protein